MSTTPTPPPEGTLVQQSTSFLLETGIREIALQKEMRDHIDTKTTVVLGFALASVVELLGFMLLVAAENHTLGRLPWYFFALLIAGVVSVVVTASVCVFQLWPMRLYYADLERVRFTLRSGVLGSEAGKALVRKYRASAFLNGKNLDLKSSLASAAASAGTAALIIFSSCVMWLLVAIAHDP
jgi:heme/copper-type cytochrome/quinol oxidase subunit 4